MERGFYYFVVFFGIAGLICPFVAVKQMGIGVLKGFNGFIYFLGIVLSAGILMYLITVLLAAYFLARTGAFD